MCLVDGDLIQPDLIPGADIDPATLAGSATGFSTAGTAVTEKGAAVVTQWAGLSGVYVAPESAELLEVMAPVAVDSAALGQTFSSLSTIIANFADDVAPVKARLAIIREEARAFVARVSDGVTVDIWDGDHPAYNAGVLSFMVTDFADMGPTVINWREHKPSVEENKDLIHRVNVEVAALDTVRVDCVNAINALRRDVCVVDAMALTVADLDSEGVSLPWGAATDGDRSCSESFGDGIADSAVGMWEGGGALLSYNSDTGQWGDGQLAGQVWSGLGMTVAGLALVGPISILSMTVPKSSVPGWLHGTQNFVNGSQEALFAAAKGIVAADKWAENPAEAAGTALLNIGTFFIPGGAVVGGVKAGTITARVSSIIGHTIDVVLPGVTVVTRAGGAVLHVGQGLTVVTDLAKTGLFSGVSTGRAALAQALHSIADQTPAVHIEPGYLAVTPDGAVGFGAPPHLAVGEAGSGGSALHSIADRVTPSAAAAAPPVAAHVDVPVDAAPRPTADAPAGAIDDVTPHATSSDAPSTDAGPAGTVFNGSAPVALENGTSYTPAFSDSGIAAAGYSSFEDSLPVVLDRAGVSMPEFTRLVETPLAGLTRHEMSLLIDIRDALPSPDNTGHLQKTVPWEQAEIIIDQMPVTMQDLQGFVARPADTAGMTPTQMHDALGLNYPGSQYTSDIAAGRPYFDVRFETSGVAAPRVPDSAVQWMEAELPDSIFSISDAILRADAVQAFWDNLFPAEKSALEVRHPSLVRELAQALDPKNPFRGSGFSGTGSGFVPEATFGRNRIALPDGSELWRTLPDGTRELVGVFDRSNPSIAGSWVLVDSLNPRSFLDATPSGFAAPVR
ncbi:hypothetical protein E3O25_14680 [Cryobacterium sp. TMT1-3]|nr:hypothetical protein [Cryobacterium sp. TMT1-3]TFC24429.1 hypothetical protein E3O25_14680 [Cryobacterium sp. TMT1-3]